MRLSGQKLSTNADVTRLSLPRPSCERLNPLQVLDFDPVFHLLNRCAAKTMLAATRA
jgi:hypothetical protein